MGLPGQVEGQPVEQGADDLATERREQATGAAEQDEFGAPRPLQQLAPGTQGAQQGAQSTAGMVGLGERLDGLVRQFRV